MGGNYIIKKSKILLLFVLLVVLVFTIFSESEKSAIQLYNEGKAAEDRANYYLAIERYKAALALNPHYLKPIKGLAQCFFRLNEYYESLRYIELGKKYNKNDHKISLVHCLTWHR